MRFSKSGSAISYRNKSVYTSSFSWFTSKSSSKPYILPFLDCPRLRFMILFFTDARSGITSSRLSQISSFRHRTDSNCFERSMLSPMKSSFVILCRAEPNSTDILVLRMILHRLRRNFCLWSGFRRCSIFPEELFRRDRRLLLLRLSSHGQLEFHSLFDCKSRRLLMSRFGIWWWWGFLLTGHSLCSSTRQHCSPEYAIKYHFEVIFYVLVIKSKKLNKNSIGIAEKNCFLWLVRFVDDLSCQKVFSDSVVNNSSIYTQIYVSRVSSSVVLT